MQFIKSWMASEILQPNLRNQRRALDWIRLGENERPSGILGSFCIFDPHSCIDIDPPCIYEDNMFAGSRDSLISRDFYNHLLDSFRAKLLPASCIVHLLVVLVRKESFPSKDSLAYENTQHGFCRNLRK